jgi:TrmH family RNA methyltransferase
VSTARRDTGRVVLEGLHALKHALRFGAAVDGAWTPDRARLLALVDELAPDLAPRVADLVHEVDAATWAALAPHGLPSPCLAVAPRPATTPDEVLAGAGPRPVVLLEEPRHLGNLGAVVRVAAAADAGGVLTTGPSDPWAPGAVRGAAGLQFAVPTARASALPESDRPLVAIDPEGEPLDAAALPSGAVLAFGTERHGLSPALLERADLRVRIPMRAGISSLNLATAVAVVLYTTEPAGASQ